MKYITTINDKQFEIEIGNDGRVLVNGEPREVDFLPLEASLYSIIMNNQSLQVVVGEGDGMYDLMIRGRRYEGKVLDERAQLMLMRGGLGESDSGEITIRSPMPGLVVAIPVTEGEEIVKGQTVIILESMKMQNELKSPRDGTVQRISVVPGESVEQKKILITIV